MGKRWRSIDQAKLERRRKARAGTKPRASSPKAEEAVQCAVCQQQIAKGAAVQTYQEQLVHPACKRMQQETDRLRAL